MANQPGFKSSASGIVIGSANVAFCSLDGSSSTDAFGVSVGNTSQRPSTPQTGMLRWNTDQAAFEYWNGSAWTLFGVTAVSWKQNGAAIVSVGTANFINTASVQWTLNANGSQVNISATSTGAGGTINVGSNSTYDLAIGNLNFINTSTLNVAIQANTGNTANVVFNVNNAIMNATFSTINSTTSTMNSNMDAANAAISALNSAAGTDNTTFSTINSTFSTINTTFGTVNTEINNLNAAEAAQNANINLALDIGFMAYDQANAALVIGTRGAANDVSEVAAIVSINTALSVHNTNFSSINAALSTTNATFANINTAETQMNSNITLSAAVGYLAYDQANAAIRIAKGFQANAGVSAISEESFVATANQTQFTLANILSPANVNYLLVTRNGLVLEPGTHYSLVGQTLTLTSNCSIGDTLDVREFLSANLVGTSYIAVETFTATTNQTTYVLNNQLSPSQAPYIMVFRNGIEQAPNTHYTLVGQTLTFTSNTILNDLIEVREFINIQTVLPSQILVETFTATANQTAFTLVNVPQPSNNPNYLLVHINGLEQTPTTHYTLSGQTLTFSSNCALNDKIEVREFFGVNVVTLVAGSNTQIQFNNNGKLSANANLTWDTGNNALQVGGGIANGAFTGVGTGRALLVLQGGGTQNDAAIFFQNNSGYVGTMIYANNTLMQLYVGTARAANVTNTGAFQVPSSPLVNTQTQIFTGLAAFLKANVTRTTATNPTAEANLTLTFNETGVYEVRANWLFFCSAGTGACTDFQFTIGGGGGTATLNTGGFSVSSVNNHQYSAGTAGLWGPTQMTGGIYGVCPTNPGVITTSSGNPDWVQFTGTFVVNVAGTVIPSWGLGTSANASNNVTLLANSYWIATKIG